MEMDHHAEQAKGSEFVLVLNSGSSSIKFQVLDPNQDALELSLIHI
mgnify:CR=1 FL=1